MNFKFYINGAEVSERNFKIQNYLYNPLNHYCVTNNKITYEWGRLPNIFGNKPEDKND